MRLFKNPFPWLLVAAHAVIVIGLSPIMLTTVNTETAPIGLVLIALVDQPALWITPEWIISGSAFPPGALRSGWSFVVFPLLAGSVQWYLIGVLLAAPFELVQYLSEPVSRMGVDTDPSRQP